DVALERLGFDPTDLERLKRDREKGNASSLAAALLVQKPDPGAMESAARRGLGSAAPEDL
ncbi:hypothetical protein, partial [Brevibacterium otitidis]